MTILILCIGLAFGSLVTLLSYRLPLGEDVVIKPSRCPKCDTALQFLDLWPVLSWLCSRGRCRHCHAPISIRYPVIELITATMFLFLYSKYGLTPQAIILAMVWVALMVMIVVDLEHYLIPDPIQVTLIILGIAYHFVVGTDAEEAASGFILGGIIGLFLHYGYSMIRKKDGLGLGDVKFLAVAGLWLGLKPLVPFLFFSGLFGIITGLIWRALGKGAIFPFGPSLAVALFLSIVEPQMSNLFWNIGQFAR